MNDARLQARLRERIANSTVLFKRAFGYPPTRWLQMEAESGTLGACQRILASRDFVSQLTPMWEKRLLGETVEAIVLEREFRSLFTEAELAEAKRRLSDLGYATDHP